MRWNEYAATLQAANHAELLTALGEGLHHAQLAVEATRENGAVEEVSRQLELALEHLGQAREILRAVP